MTGRLRAGARGEDTRALTAGVERRRRARKRLMLARPGGYTRRENAVAGGATAEPT
jgi:hypothetical protein